MGLVRRALLAAALLWLASGCQIIVRPSAHPEEATSPSPWRIAASWGAKPLVERLLQAYRAQGRWANAEVIPCIDRRAEEMVASGEAEMAFIIRPAAPMPERAGASESEVREVALARGGLALVVHPSMPLAQIAPEDLAALYEGFVVDWAALGGPQGAPEIISRPEGDVAREVFEKAVMPGRALTSAALLLPHDEAVLDYVSKHPLAIGYVSSALVDERVKVISLGGLLPSVRTLAQGRYPLTFTLALLTRAEAPAEAVRFASFVRGGQARRLIAERYAPAR